MVGVDTGDWTVFRIYQRKGGEGSQEQGPVWTSRAAGCAEGSPRAPPQAQLKKQGLPIMSPRGGRHRPQGALAQHLQGHQCGTEACSSPLSLLFYCFRPP